MSCTQKTSLTPFLSYLPYLLNLLMVLALTSLRVEIFLLIINRDA